MARLYALAFSDQPCGEPYAFLCSACAVQEPCEKFRLPSSAIGLSRVHCIRVSLRARARIIHAVLLGAHIV